MYSISNAASRAATPMQLGGGDQLVMLTGKYIVVLQKVTIFLRKNYIRGSSQLLLFSHGTLGVLETQLKGQRPRRRVYGTQPTLLQVVTLVI